MLSPSDQKLNPILHRITMPDVPQNQLDLVDVIIPALNEESSLPMVFKDLPNVGRVIVVNNGSTDRTAAVAKQHGAIVVDEPQRGYGAACLRGMREIEQRSAAGERDPKIVVFLDADYSDHPDQLPRLVAPIFGGESDFVLGSRLLGEREHGAMPPQSVYGNMLACALMRLLFGVKFTDLGPFRAIGYEDLLRLQMCDENFGWTIEMQIKATRAGIRTVEIPVAYRRRVGVSKISGTISGTIRAGYKILATIARYGLQRRGSNPALSVIDPTMEADKANRAAV